MTTLLQFTPLAYLISAVLFILALRGLSSPSTARLGNVYGMLGMLLAVLTTFCIIESPALLLMGLAILAGAVVGAVAAKSVQMTKMPELVALMHSFVGIYFQERQILYFLMALIISAGLTTLAALQMIFSYYFL